MVSERGTFDGNTEQKNSISASVITKYKKTFDSDVDIFCFQEYNGTRSNEKGVCTEIMSKKTNKFSCAPKTGNNERINIVSMNYFSPYDTRRENPIPISIVNIHGRIFSKTSSSSQIEKGIKLLESLLSGHKTISIICGDFNIGILDKKLINDTTSEFLQSNKLSKTNGPKIKNDSKQRSIWLKRLGNIQRQMKRNYRIYPSDCGSPTNSWSLINTSGHNYKPEKQTCVDSFLISNDLIGLLNPKGKTTNDSIKFNILSKYMATDSQKRTFMENDFDHTPIMVEMTFLPGTHISFD